MENGSEPDQNSRRNFLRKVGVALGGVTLAGSGQYDAARAQGVLPNGYKFFRVLTIGVPLPNGANPVAVLGAGVMLGSFEHPLKNTHSDVLYFHGTATEQARPGQPQALFSANIEYSGSRPTVTQASVVVAQGDELDRVANVPSTELPIVVGTLGIGSANSSANYATTISVSDYGDQSGDGSVQTKSAPGVYLYEPLEGNWKKIARLGDPAPGGGQYGGFFGDVKLNEDNSLDIAAATTAPPNTPGVAGAAARSRVPWFVGSHALIHVPPEARAEGIVLLKTGDLLPGTAAVIETFGLLDVLNAEHFVTQVNARRLDIVNALPGTAVVRGRLGADKTLDADRVELLTASHHVVSNAAAEQLRTLVGESFLGPRIGHNGFTAAVTHAITPVPSGGSFDLQRLSVWGRRGRELVMRAGDRNIQTASSLSAPVVSSQSAITYEARQLADGTTELLVSDGTDTRVILRSGDVIDGLQVTEINHGYHPAQVDFAGRIAFSGEFVKAGQNPQNPDAILSCVIVGIPV